MARVQAKYARELAEYIFFCRLAANSHSEFANWVKECDEEDDFLGTPRFQACAMVTQFEIELMLKGPPADEFDASGAGFLTLVSLDEDEDYQMVGLSYLVPRIYTLLEGPGWENIVEDGVAIP
jgi:hypothetical protein